MVSKISALSSSDLWIVGQTSNQQPLLAHWDGNSWMRIALSNPQVRGTTLNAVAALSTDDVWAVGSTFSGDGKTASRKPLAAHWDGNTLHMVPVPSVDSSDDGLSSIVAISTNNVWAVGYKGNMPLILHWDGAKWKEDQSLNLVSTTFEKSSLVGIAATPQGKIWAVGYYQRGSCCPPDNEPFVVRLYDGKWNVVTTPTFGGGILPNAVTAIADNDVWVVGSWGLTLHWDGTAWTNVPNPLKDTGYTLNSVSAETSQNVWAVGGTDTGGASPPVVLHWDGSTWHSVSIPKVAPGQLLYGVAITSTDVWAVGGTLSGVETGPWLPLIGWLPRASCLPSGSLHLRPLGGNIMAGAARST